MKCEGCQYKRGEICGLAQEGLLSKMDLECLIRCQVMLLRDIWIELRILNSDEIEDEE